MEGSAEGVAIKRTLHLVAGLVLILTSAALAGCTGQLGVIPSALDTQAIDVAAEGTPTALPPRSTGVPADSILERTQWIARRHGRELASTTWFDFEKSRERGDIYGDATSMLGGPTTTAVDPAAANILYAYARDDTRDISFDARSAELRTGPSHSSEPEYSGGQEDTVLLGEQELDGGRADVYRVDLNIPSGQERTADFGLTYVDVATGIRLREEWLLGSPGHAHVYHLLEYRLLPRSAQLEARMKPEALIEEGAQAVAEHMARVAKLDFPVWGLPSATDGLVLSGATITVSDRGTSVVLAYAAEDSHGTPAVTIETTDLRGRPDFPEDLLRTRDEAIANPRNDNVLDFRMGDDAGGQDATAVRILLWPESVKPADMPSLASLAEDLVDVRSQGSQ